MSKDYNQVKNELFNSLEKALDLWEPLFEQILAGESNNEGCECKCDEPCSENKNCSCVCTEECDKSCLKGCNCQEKNLVCNKFGGLDVDKQDVQDDKEVQKISIAEQLYTKHYNTWNILHPTNELLSATENTSPILEEKKDVITPVVDKIIILFKNILNGTAYPDPANAGFKNLYYELSAEHHFDYYVTFGGSFDGIGEAPYVKVGIDLLDLHDDDFILFNKERENAISKDDYLMAFANQLSSRLGFASYDIEVDNENQLILKMFYWDV